jgi:hypothetical protein
MDVDAARRARRKAIKDDLAEAYTDEEASPPEWVDLLAQVRADAARLRDEVADETSRFVTEPDIRSALTRRERFASAARERVVKINDKTRRLNLIAPNSRFTRATLDAEELLRPLYRSTRTPLER